MSEETVVRLSVRQPVAERFDGQAEMLAELGDVEVALEALRARRARLIEAYRAKLSEVSTFRPQKRPQNVCGALAIGVGLALQFLGNLPGVARLIGIAT
jgi:hypothetical protein